jgi:hypothetical protein
VELQAPTVDEAPDNATLDPDDITLEAIVRIAPYPGMAINDRIDMYWVGSSGASGSFSDWNIVGSNSVGRPMLFYVDKEYVTANDGGTVTVYYTVTKADGSVQKSMSLMLRVGEQQEIPVSNSDIIVVNADPLTQTLNLVGAHYFNGGLGTPVLIRYDGIRIGDVVTIFLQGPPGFGVYQQATRVTDLIMYSNGVWLGLDESVLAPYYNSSVRIGYTVQRNGIPVGPTEPTSWYELLIQNIPLQGVLRRISGGGVAYYCSIPQTSITIPEDLPIGAEIFTTTECLVMYDTDTSMEFSTNPSTFVTTYGWAQQPKSDSITFQAVFADTPIASTSGVAYQILFDAGDGKGANPLSAGPWIYPEDTFVQARGSKAYLRFIKTGPITSGMITAQVNAAYLTFGYGRTIFGLFSPYPAVTINVVPAGKHHAALPAAQT